MEWVIIHTPQINQKKLEAHTGVRISQFSTKENFGQKHSKWSKKHFKINLVFPPFLAGWGVFSPKLNFSASKLFHATILRLLADLYYTEFVS